MEFIFQSMENKFQTLENRFQSLESNFTSGRKDFSIVMQYFAPRRQKTHILKKILRSTYKTNSIHLLEKFTAIGMSYL